MSYAICGKCEKEYKTQNGYLNHTCDVTGFTPTEPEHQGEQFVRQSIAAHKRGGSKKNAKVIKGLEKKLDSGIPHEVSNKIRADRVKNKKAQRVKKREKLEAKIAKKADKKK